VTVTKQQLDIKVAQRLAQRIKSELSSACEAIEIVGSVRRGKPQVGDLELLAIPRFGEAPRDLFGRPTEQPPDRLDQKLRQLLQKGRLRTGPRYGPQWKSLEVARWPGLMLELYSCDRENWGVQMAIRTGPAEFSKALVTAREWGGYLPAGHQITGGFRLHRHGELVPCETEADFFEAMGMAWIEPEER
jgi:DNA polymerase/3'-5' exonuclease PolX